ncbi:MAG: phosphopentomutase, partial [Rhizobiales bacterium]|nr:phosphopentomutase [Hyphomicrobiales bacterium]
MARAFLFVLDSFGIGGGPDAKAFGDLGANTLGHIAEFCAAGAADRAGLRQGPLRLPNMSALGLLHAARAATGAFPPGMEVPQRVFGYHGAASEVSNGKDTPSGHWEIAGTPVTFDWGYFPSEGDAFEPDLVEAICSAGKVPGILGNCHASGTDIIARHGLEHMRSGKP